jgi:molybdopterin-biosynthesis enzyme MoeA-like protein
MAWPMVEWVLDQRYLSLFHRRPEAESSIIVYESAESTLTPLMEAVEAKYRGLKVFSLPSVAEGGRRRHIELGVRGAPGEVAPAMEALKRGVTEVGGTWEAHGGTPAPEAAGP